MIGGHVRNYTPTKHPVNEFKATVRYVWNRECWRTEWDFEAPMQIIIQAVFPRPKSKTKKRGDNPREWKLSKPDWDNVGKSVCDALNGLAYNDDSQIVSARVTKYIASADEQPHVSIVIETLEGVQP
jgi:Holliday junction resolvase RusA-like endonuclease